MKETDILLWHVYAADGELIAATRYAYSAAEMALRAGRGAKVSHTRRVVLTVGERHAATWEAADNAAKAMIAAAYGKLEDVKRAPT